MKRHLDLKRLAKGLLVTILETAGLTLWLVTYVHGPYVDPVKSTVIVLLFLFPEHYIAIGPSKLPVSLRNNPRFN